MMIGEYGENMPTEVGGNSATYYCDYYYTNIPASGTAMRGVLFGGYANTGAAAGLSYAATNSTATSSSAYLGSRLCFIPEA